MSGALTKSSRKRSKNPYHSMSVYRPIASSRYGLGNSAWPRLNYADVVSINPGIATAAYHVFRISSLYDPDETGVGHQPKPFDQLSPLFEFYCVYKVDYKVTFTNVTTDMDYVVMLQAADASSTDLNIGTQVEQGETQWRILSTRGGGVPTVTFTGSVDIAKLQGKSRKALLADDSYKARMTTNPGENSWLILGAAAADGVSNPAALYCYVELIFHTKMEGSKLVIAS